MYVFTFENILSSLVSNLKNSVCQWQLLAEYRRWRDLPQRLLIGRVSLFESMAYFMVTHLTDRRRRRL
jgi:hypothetical protein